MKRSMFLWRKIFVASLLAGLLAGLSVVPAACATPTDLTGCAAVDGTAYASADEAIAAADEGGTVTLLSDAVVTKAFDKSLTFTGSGTLRMSLLAWYYNHELVFDGSGVKFEYAAPAADPSAKGASPWLMMCLNGTLRFDNGAAGLFSFDSSTGVNCAIYTAEQGSSQIIVDNGASLSFLGANTAGVTGQAIQLGATANATITVKNQSTFLIDGTNRGYVNSPEIYVEDSTFTVKNCTNNASNGGDFTAVNSQINFTNNAVLGLSATNMHAENAVFHCDNNGYTGLFLRGGTALFDKQSQVYVNGNCTQFVPYGAFLCGCPTTFKAGTLLQVNHNSATGIRVVASESCSGALSVEEGAVCEIMRNRSIAEPAPAKLLGEISGLAFGGGLWISGTAKLPGNAKIYNNHALRAGDDIFVEKSGSLALGAVGTDWLLDDCEHKITGWFYDGSSDSTAPAARWNGISGKSEKTASRCVDQNSAACYKEFPVPQNAVNGELALKAAHGFLQTKVSRNDSAPATLTSPKTGDLVSLWAVLGVSSSVGLLSLTYRQRKRGR